MKMNPWVSLFGVVAIGLWAIQAPAESTTKGERFGVGPIYGVSQAGGGQTPKCPHCKYALAAVRVPLDSKERARGVRFVQEHRCRGCTFGLRITKAGSKETRTVMTCSAPCKP